MIYITENERSSKESEHQAEINARKNIVTDHQCLSCNINKDSTDENKHDVDRYSLIKAKSVVELKLSWVERNQLNSILSLSWSWVDLSQSELNLRSSWVAWTRFLKIVYLLICTEFSCKLNSNSISKNRIITRMHEVFMQTEFSRTLI